MLASVEGKLLKEKLEVSYKRNLKKNKVKGRRRDAEIGKSLKGTVKM